MSYAGPEVFMPDVRAREQLIAFRHLPSNYHGTPQHNSLLRGLLDELLNLDDEGDPLAWLMRERSELASLLVIASALDAAVALRAARMAVAQHATNELLDEQSAGRYSLLMTAMSGVGASPGTSGTWMDRIEESRQILSALEALRQPNLSFRVEKPRLSLVDPSIEAVLADLLQLPDAADPLAWLASSRLELCGRLALDYVLRSAWPAPMLSSLVTAGDALRDPVHPRKHLRAGTIKIAVRQVDLFTTGFSIRLAVRFRRPKGLRPGVVARWEGFTRATDSKGNHYLVQPAELEAYTSFGGWWREHLTLFCWPPIDLAEHLHLESRPVALSVFEPPTVGGILIPRPSTSWGTHMCSMKLS